MPSFFPETRVTVIAVALSGVLITGCGGSGSDSASSSSGGANIVEQELTGDAAVSLSWLAPGRRVNGDQLSYQTDISGYIVRYGQDPSDLRHQAKVPCQVLECSYTVEGLESGTWYFAVQTMDRTGLVSAPSTPVSRAI